MAKPNGAGKIPSLEKRGGYESGSKKVTELAPPPKGPGAGAKPASGESAKST
jgi:hypothetical protein